MKPEIIKIDEVEYVRRDSISEKPINSDIKIVILQRGWIMVGRFVRNGSDCELHNASVIRSWGTSNGIGELAKYGKKTNTKLDKCYGIVRFDYLTVVSTIDCEVSVWEKEL
jgi:hypothetical protein